MINKALNEFFVKAATIGTSIFLQAMKDTHHKKIKIKYIQVFNSKKHL